MGGTLDPMAESIMSNIPFWAMISGEQGSPTDSFGNLVWKPSPSMPVLVRQLQPHGFRVGEEYHSIFW